ncbi:MAG: tripartite tricarboxylate transporter TctB family protein [Candidatus Atribacteria bacterium]|nr:tripartite tricarboxylate transporter TctB family protein [Candidatus Atribacteria bacterium]
MMRKKVNIMGNLISYFAFCCLGFFIVYLSLSIRAESALFPLVLSYLLILFNLGLIVNNILGWYSKKNKEKYLNEKGKIDNTTKINKNISYEIYPFIAIILCIFFIIGFEKIGFDLSAFMLTFTVMILINSKEAFRKFYIALIIPAILILIFKIGLNLRMPLFIEFFLG